MYLLRLNMGRAVVIWQEEKELRFVIDCHVNQPNPSMSKTERMDSATNKQIWSAWTLRGVGWWSSSESLSGAWIIQNVIRLLCAPLVASVRPRVWILNAERFRISTRPAFLLSRVEIELKIIVWAHFCKDPILQVSCFLKSSTVRPPLIWGGL